MSQRKLYISPFLIGQMDVVQEISNKDLFINKLNIPRINTYSITLDYLVQSGVDVFVTGSLDFYDRFLAENKNDKKFYSFLKEKAKNIPDEKIDTAYKSIEDIFQYYLPENYYFDKKYQKIQGIKSLLNDLMIASNTGTSLFRSVNTITKDLENAKDLLPPELFLPIKYLISSICHDTVDLPHTKHYLNKEDIRRFEIVFNEKEFSNYKLAHSTLDDVETIKSSALSNIQNSSLNLYRKHSGLLNIKKSILTTLSVTPKLIEASFGKIPGTIAELATRILTNFIDTNCRIVIYDYDPIYNEIFYERILIPLTKINQDERKTV